MCLYLSWQKSAWELFLVARKKEFSTVLKPCFKSIPQLTVFNFETNIFRLLFLKHTQPIFFVSKVKHVKNSLCDLKTSVENFLWRGKRDNKFERTSSRERVGENKFSTADRRCRMFGMCVVYGVATISRLLKILGLFCRISPLL